MKPRGKKLKDITDFWEDVPNTSLFCKCGKKVVMCGFCQECLDKNGKEIVLEVAAEQKLINAQRNAEDMYYEKILSA